MNKSISYISWLALVVALLSWAAVAYAGIRIQETARTSGTRALNSDQQASLAAQKSRLHALAVDTQMDRESLETLMQSDIVSIANTIESTGRSAGVVARVSAAIPTGNPKEIPGGAPLYSVAFIVQAEGTFAGLNNALRLFEKLPYLATVEQFEFERGGSAEKNAPPWRMNVRIRILTTSAITS